MANLVINVGPNKQVASYETLEKWRDLGIDAVYNDNYRKMDDVYLSSYVNWLVTERGNSIIDSGKLSCFLLEDHKLNVNNEDDLNNNISAIAVCVKGGYDAARDLYEQYTNPYRWRVSKLVNVKAVQSSIHHIFTWTPGERIINPEFGNRLKIYLYEGITDYNVEQIKSEIMQCVSMWEPRANIIDIIDASTVEDTEDNTVHLEIVYTIPSLSNEQFRYSYYYKRGT